MQGYTTTLLYAAQRIYPMSFQSKALLEQRNHVEQRIRDGDLELFDPLSARLISLVAMEPDRKEVTSEVDKEERRLRRERHAKFGPPTADYSWAYFPDNDQWVAFTRESTNTIRQVKDASEAQANRKKRTARFDIGDVPTWIITCDDEWQ